MKLPKPRLLRAGDEHGVTECKTGNLPYNFDWF
jgi:hypothetical protein